MTSLPHLNLPSFHLLLSLMLFLLLTALHLWLLLPLLLLVTIPKSTSAASATASSPPKVKYFSLIVAYFHVDSAFLSSLQRLMKHEYLLEFIQGGLKIRVSHHVDFQWFTQYLESQHYEYYDFGEDSLKTVKFVIRGLLATTEPAAIQSELMGSGLQIKAIQQMSKLSTMLPQMLGKLLPYHCLSSPSHVLRNKFKC